MEGLDNTEIAVHDNGLRVASLMYYEGGSTNRITIGRNMGWGTADSRIEGALSLKTDLYHNSTDGNDRLWYATNATTYYRGHGNAFTIA